MNVDAKRIDPRKIRLLEKNAHFMRHEMFARLTHNIKDDGALTSTPFCAPLGYYTAEDELQRDEDGEIIYEVLSGNHRVQGSVEAGLASIIILYTDDPVPLDRRLAIQLSHNAIFGEDDPTILKELYEAIQDLELKAYSGLDDKSLALLAEVNVSGLSEAALKFQVITFTFLPEEVEELKRIFDDVKKLAAGDELWVAQWGAYERFLDTLDEVSSSYDIRNAATSLQAILALADKHKMELADGWYNAETGTAVHSNWVPISTILNTGKLPAKGAAVVRQAVDKLIGKGEIEANQRWKSLVVLAEKYLKE
jgi:hypothetical protein